MAPQTISYTRNAEDVILQRVFADIPAGRFLDVGADAPVKDSNTFALYRKGWRGIAVEPRHQELKAAWAEARPEDVFIGAAAGAAEGRVNMTLFRKRQVSSGDAATTGRWLRAGAEWTGFLDVPVVTLDSVLHEHGHGLPLHLVSIDVEGMEGDVLKGLDLRAHRPWLLVIEATQPGSPLPSHQGWEPALLEAGYAMRYFDGVNRFYLAHEHDHLSSRCSLPPNVWDNYVLARELELRARVDELERELALLRSGTR